MALNVGGSSGQDRLPVIPGHEVSGTVAALGYGTTGFAVGDEVFGITDWYRDGTAAEFVAVEARNLARKPSSLSHADAASLSLAALTAWQALFEHGHLQSGQTVIITGASGGVGTLTVQLAVHAGAEVVAVAHGWAHPLLRELGAQHVADADEVRHAQLPQADLLCDLVGGDLAAECAAAIGAKGTAVSIVDPIASGPDKCGVFFVVEPDRGQLQELCQLVDAGHIHPVVGKVVGLSKGATEGFELKQGGGVPGKVVLQPPRRT
jgi:NADPH:quinone reductase-like Zn-dependent oxidoreductase